MPKAPQTYRTHRRLLPPYHFFVIPVLLVNLGDSVWLAYQAPSLRTGWAAVVAAALFTLGLLARTMALRVQDRVIRLEMRLRLNETLPPDLRDRVGQLTPQHLIALRFAGDDELPAIVRDVLAGTLTSGEAIKRRVQNWQGDELRC